MASFEGKVIALTGAASGIGKATALHLASRGAKLSLADITEDPLNELVSQIKSSGGDAIGTKIDVRQHEQVDKWIEDTVKHFGQLNGAANIAGVAGKAGVFTDLEHLKNEEWDFIIGVNLTGTMYCMRAEVRAMGKGSAIVNVASIAGLMGRAGLMSYSVSKHGVVGMTRTAAKEVGSKGIRVNAVAPGPIETPMLDWLIAESPQGSSVTATYKSLPIGRTGQSEEIAKTIAFLLSDDASFTTGSIYPVDGGAIC